MKVLRRITLAGASWLFAASALAQGIPVIDAAALVQQIQQVAAWANQYSQMVEQYQKMTEQLNAIKGMRGMGNLLNVSSLRQQLPTDFISQFDKLRNMGAAGATAEAIAIYDSIKTFNCASQFPSNQASRVSCEASAMVQPTNLSLINKSITSSTNRMTQLQGLMSTIDSADDIKAAQDLANRISLEVAVLQNEKMLMDMALAAQENQAKLNQQQRIEQGLKKFSEGGSNPFSYQK